MIAPAPLSYIKMINKFSSKLTTATVAVSKTAAATTTTATLSPQTRLTAPVSSPETITRNLSPGFPVKSSSTLSPSWVMSSMAEPTPLIGKRFFSTAKTSPVSNAQESVPVEAWEDSYPSVPVWSSVHGNISTSPWYGLSSSSSSPQSTFSVDTSPSMMEQQGHHQIRYMTTTVTATAEAEAIAAATAGAKATTATTATTTATTSSSDRQTRRMSVCSSSSPEGNYQVSLGVPPEIWEDVYPSCQ